MIDTLNTKGQIWWVVVARASSTYWYSFPETIHLIFQSIVIILMSKLVIGNNTIVLLFLAYPMLRVTQLWFVILIPVCKMYILVDWTDPTFWHLHHPLLREFPKSQPTSTRITQFNLKRDRGAQIMGLFYSSVFVVSSRLSI